MQIPQNKNRKCVKKQTPSGPAKYYTILCKQDPTIQKDEKINQMLEQLMLYSI